MADTAQLQRTERIARPAVPISPDEGKDEKKSASVIKCPEIQAVVSRLHISAQIAEVEVIQSLVEHLTGSAAARDACKMIIDHPDAEGWTALHYAAQGGTPDHTMIIKTLCNCKANTNIANVDGNTPLHLAAQFAEPAAIDILVDALAVRKTLNKLGRSARDCANGKERHKQLESSTDAIEVLTARGSSLLSSAERADFLQQYDAHQAMTFAEELEDEIGRQYHQIQNIQERSHEILSEQLGSDRSKSELFADMKTVIEYKIKSEGLTTQAEEAQLFRTQLRRRGADSLVQQVFRDLEVAIINFDKLALHAHADLGHIKHQKTVRYAHLLRALRHALEAGRCGGIDEDGDEVPLDVDHASDPVLLRASLAIVERLIKLGGVHTDSKMQLVLEQEVLGLIKRSNKEKGYSGPSKFACQDPCVVQ